VYDGNIEWLRADYDTAIAEAAILGGPLVVGEFGGNADGFLPATEQFLRDTYDELDRHLSGGTVWAYFPQGNGFSVVDANGVEKGHLVDMIARPYARRIAGIPLAMSFDVKTKEFNLSFRDDEARQPLDPTEIFVPASRHYPNGFTIEVSEGDHWKLDASGTRIMLFRGGGSEHHLRLKAD
jgi:hypothetical protein